MWHTMNNSLAFIHHMRLIIPVVVPLHYWISQLNDVLRHFGKPALFCFLFLLLSLWFSEAVVVYLKYCKEKIFYEKMRTYIKLQ